MSMAIAVEGGIMGKERRDGRCALGGKVTHLLGQTEWVEYNVWV